MDDKMFNELLESVKQAGRIHRGEEKPSRKFVFDKIDVKAVREQIGLSQSKFATTIGVSVRTLQNWEQGHRHPQGPALALLTIFKNDPEHAIKALHQR
jgi:putative transcriptional regulator